MSAPHPSPTPVSGREGRSPSGADAGNGNGLTPRKATAATWLRRLVGFAILGATVYLVHRLVAEVGWDEVRERLAGARLEVVAVAVLCFVAQFSLWTIRQWISVRRVIDTPPGWAVFSSLVATAAANYLVPFARLVGGLLRARYLSRTSRPQAPKRVYYGAVLFDQTTHLAIMGGFTLVGLVVGALILGRPWAAAWIAAALAAGGLAVAAWIRHRASGEGGTAAVFIRFLERRAERREGMAGSFLAGSETAARIYFRLLADRRLWRSTFGLGLGIFAAVAGAQWVVFYSLGDVIDPLLIITTLAIGLTAGVLLGTPGGLGTTEATMIALYGALGVDRVDAASAVLLFRGLQFGVVLVLGLPAMAALELYGTRVRAAEDPDERPAAEEVSSEAAEGLEGPSGPSEPGAGDGTAGSASA